VALVLDQGSEMEQKDLLEALKSGLEHIQEIEVHEWPFEEEADKAFYIETRDGKRYSVRVEEIARFQAGSMNL
jgi:hypothetical protein